jgi:hypothetical protein
MSYGISFTIKCPEYRAKLGKCGLKYMQPGIIDIEIGFALHQRIFDQLQIGRQQLLLTLYGKHDYICIKSTDS